MSRFRETLKNTNHPSVYKRYRIKQRIKQNGACPICIRRQSGKVKKYKTYC